MDRKGRVKSRSPTRGVRRAKSCQNDALRSRSQSRSQLVSSSHHSKASSGSEFKRAAPNRTTSFGGRRPPSRTQSFGLERGRKPPPRTRSYGQQRDLEQMAKYRNARSASPSLRMGRGRSKSIDMGGRVRGRSNDRVRGRSNGAAYRARSRSRDRDLFSDEIIKKDYPKQRPKKDKNISRRAMRTLKKMPKRISHIPRHIKKPDEVSWSKVCQYIIPIFIILGASVGLLFATGNGDIVTDAIDKIINTIDPQQLIDPNRGKSAPHWPANGNGLRVTIINALSEEWQTTFYLATADWSTGDPNAVEITEEAGTPTSECEAPEGKVIVCNGDYGDSKWRGVNESMLNPRGLMISSTARMNEFYLSSMGKGAWQYTMCHEIGHTLGLGHTDEIFDNPDLGNCMDYTDNLDANKHPDKSNYETLYNIYGPIGGSEPTGERHLQRHASRPQNTELNVSVKHLRKRDPSNEETRLDKDNTTNGNGNVVVGAIPDHIKVRKKEAVQKLFNRVRSTYNNDDYHKTPAGHTHEDGWKLIHRKHDGEEHETDLGEGYKVRIQLLLVD